MTVRAAAGIMATMAALLVLACTSSPQSAPDGAGSDTGVDTDAVSATCAMQADSALRGDWDVQVAPPEAVVLAPDGQGVWYQALETGLDDGRHTVKGIALTTDARMGVLVDSERDPTAVKNGSTRPNHSMQRTALRAVADAERSCRVADLIAKGGLST